MHLSPTSKLGYLSFNVTMMGMLQEKHSEAFGLNQLIVDRCKNNDVDLK